MCFQLNFTFALMQQRTWTKLTLDIWLESNQQFIVMLSHRYSGLGIWYHVIGIWNCRNYSQGKDFLTIIQELSDKWQSIFLDKNQVNSTSLIRKNNCRHVQGALVMSDVTDIGKPIENCFGKCRDYLWKKLFNYTSEKIWAK